MAGINKAIILGRLGGDPEIRRSQDGRPIASFSVATSDEWKDKSTGERQERVQWHRVVCFNEHLCKIVEQYVKKGSLVYIEGAIENRKWTDQLGNDRYVTEIVMKFDAKLKLCGGKGNGGPPPNDDIDRTQGTRTLAPRGAGGISSGRTSDMDDEIPF
jgi:single-strand DNA-binding protein